MIFIREPILLSTLRKAINAAYTLDETSCVNTLLAQLEFSAIQNQQIHDQAYTWVKAVRSGRLKQGGITAFLQQYDLSSMEGIALMCIAEAMLRIPDAETINKLISDKLGSVDWQAHVGTSDSVLVNSATWALVLTGKIIAEPSPQLHNALKKILKRISEPLIRTAVAQAMKILCKQFVMGPNIEFALARAREHEAHGYRYSYDMLGEAAFTHEDAEQYFAAYAATINVIGKVSKGKNCIQAPGISIKLSALHPRYNEVQRDRVLAELTPKVLQLAQMAKAYNIGFTVDAEETARLDIALDIIERVFTHPTLQGWQGFGLAVQAYQKRAWYVIDWLIDLAARQQRRLMVRLVKGAYWDSEIKLAQIAGLDNYPVFTRKNNTDVSYLACAKKLLAATDTIYPQFATHNAHTLAAVLAMLPSSERLHDDFEFQCLHGMGQALYDQIVGVTQLNIPCRIYAPVGSYKNLLPYLVRRLLENGANTSFVNNVVNTKLAIDSIIANPITNVRALTNKAHPFIPLPANLYGSLRKNSRGVNLANREVLNQLSKQLSIANQMMSLNSLEHLEKVALEPAVLMAQQAFAAWNAGGIAMRADYLERTADLLEVNYVALLSLLICEAGKTLL